MNKTNAIYRGFLAIAILVSMSGCNKYSESDIEGTWVYTEESVEKDEYGNPQSFEEELQYEFDKDGNMTRTHIMKLDDTEAYSISVEGTYKYEEPTGGFDKSKAIGVIEMNYDLETMKSRFNSDILDANEQKEIETDLRKKLEEANEETQDAKRRSSSKDKYYGLLVISIDDNRMTVEGEDSKITFKKK